MDVEQTMKVNALMRELQKHGIAASPEDAFTQASAIVQQQERKIMANPESGLVLEQKQESALESRQVELLVQMQTKKLQEQFQQVVQHVQSMTLQFETLKQEFQSLKDVKTQKVVQVVQETQKELKTENKEPHPRQGNYNSTDVDIGKFFYFGHK